MPFLDGSGPFGQGPMGRGMGPCGAGRSGDFGYGFGRGFRGGGNFPGCWNRPRLRWGALRSGAVGPQDEVQALKREGSYLQDELAAVQKRLAELEGA